jgi:hypothetical protein
MEQWARCDGIGFLWGNPTYKWNSANIAMGFGHSLPIRAIIGQSAIAAHGEMLRPGTCWHVQGDFYFRKVPASMRDRIALSAGILVSGLKRVDFPPPDREDPMLRLNVTAQGDAGVPDGDGFMLHVASVVLKFQNRFFLGVRGGSGSGQAPPPGTATLVSGRLALPVAKGIVQPTVENAWWAVPKIRQENATESKEVGDGSQGTVQAMA